MLDELDLHTLPPTNDVIDSSGMDRVYPITALGKTSFIEFQILIPAGTYMATSTTYLFCRQRICKTNGDKIGKNAAVGEKSGEWEDDSIILPTHGFGCANIRNLEVILNSENVSSSDNCYPYRHYMSTALSHNSASKTEQMHGMLWDPDTAQFDGALTKATLVGTTAPAANSSTTNTGAYNRFQLSKSETNFESCIKLNSEIFNQSRLLPPGSDLRIRISLSSPKFSLHGLSDTGDYVIVLDKAFLWIQLHNVSPSVMVGHNKLLANDQPFAYPIRTTKMKFVSASTGAANISVTNVSTKMPRRLVFGLVDSRAFNGSLKHLPFYFDVSRISSVEVRTSNRAVPFPQIDMNVGKDQYLEAYMTLLHGTGVLGTNNSIGITPHSFAKLGMGMFCLDLSAAMNSNGSEWDKIVEKPISLEIKLHSPATDHGYTLIMLMEFDGLLSIDEDKLVSL
jgi:hypothetical protein